MKKTEKLSGDAVVDRVRNFRWDLNGYEEDIHENSAYFASLEDLKDEIDLFNNSNEANNVSQSDLILKVFSKIYIHNLFNAPYIHSPLFKVSSLSDKIYEACFFMTLLTFLHTSKHIKGKSIRKFVFQYHPLNFRNKESEYYGTDALDQAEDYLRKYRNVLLSRQEIQITNIQWSAISKDSEHEWTLFFPLRDYKRSGDKSLPSAIRDTDKRFGNLYSDIIHVCNTEKDSGYEKRLMTAYSKFMSKLHKIKYENYVELAKTFLLHTDKNIEYYGMDIYKCEDGMKPYIITREVKRLSMCQSIDEENDILFQHVILKDISFPKIYEFLIDLLSNDIYYKYNKKVYFEDIFTFRCAFLFFIEYVVTSGCLIFDKLVEGALRDDGEETAKWKGWEDLFRETINEMAERVFYNPRELDFTVTAKPQENFIKFISAPVNYYVNSEFILAAGNKPTIDSVRVPLWYSEKGKH